MEFRRNASRRDRMRRVYTEQPGAAPVSKARNSRSEEAETLPSRNYSDDALPERQAPVTDLAPTSLWKISAMATLLLLCIVALELVYLYSREWSGLETAKLTAIDLTAPGNFGAWFSSMLLAVGAAACMMVFNLRQHRLDDYRGRYRMWAPASVVLMLASINASCDLTGLLASMFDQYLKGHLPGSPEIWLMGLGALAIAASGVRLMVETRESRGATAGTILAGVCYALLLTARVGRDTAMGQQFAEFASVNLVVLQTSSAMCGHVLVLLSIVLYARYVLLDSQGKIREQAEQRAQKREARRLARETAAARKEAAAAARLKPAAGDPAADPADSVATKKKAKPKTTARKTSKSPAPVLPPGYEEDDVDYGDDTDAYQAEGHQTPADTADYDDYDDYEEDDRQQSQPRVEVPTTEQKPVSGDPHRAKEAAGDPSSSGAPRKMSKAERRRERKKRRAA